jgi:hypothetical protein
VRFFAGDRRVWIAGTTCGLALGLLALAWCAAPRAYYTGTDGADLYTYVAPTPPGQDLCIQGLQVPPKTERLSMSLISAPEAAPFRPQLRFKLYFGGQSGPFRIARQGAAGLVRLNLPPQRVPADRISSAVVPLPALPPEQPYADLTLCVRADGTLVNWGGAPVPAGLEPLPTIQGHPIPARVSVFYLPRAGAKRSYLSQAPKIFQRASLFRPGFVRPWLYVAIFLLVLPALGVVSVRTLARAVGGLPGRFASAVFVVCALNAACWSLITPAFQSPDEVDHFAYVQSLAERGKAPSLTPGEPFSTAEALAISGSRALTTHLNGSSRVPWLKAEFAQWRLAERRAPPSAADGGGYTAGAAIHGPVYYAALVPAYLAAGRSTFTQLTLTRLVSALMAAVAALVAFALCRVILPTRPELGVLAGLLVSFEPMYGFISGSVNNDVGVNAGAAALELLLLLAATRGLAMPVAIAIGMVGAALPLVKGTGYALYPVAGVVLVGALLRGRSRSGLAAALACLGGGLAVHFLWRYTAGTVRETASALPGGASSPLEVSSGLHQISGYLSYLWQVFLPRLSFMTPHFPPGELPAYVIYIQRGWGAFGWYDIFFPTWVYSTLVIASLGGLVAALVAAVREKRFVRRHWFGIMVILLSPVAVIAGVEYAWYTPGARIRIAEFGRYAFPAIAPLAAIAAGSLYAFGRRAAPVIAAVILAAVIALSYAGQLLTLTAFYA